MKFYKNGNLPFRVLAPMLVISKKGGYRGIGGCYGNDSANGGNGGGKG